MKISDEQIATAYMFLLGPSTFFSNLNTPLLCKWVDEESAEAAYKALTKEHPMTVGVLKAILACFPNDALIFLAQGSKMVPPMPCISEVTLCTNGRAKLCEEGDGVEAVVIGTH
jgi:hypothetical protein